MFVKSLSRIKKWFGRRIIHFVLSFVTMSVSLLLASFVFKPQYQIQVIAMAFAILCVSFGILLWWLRDGGDP